MRAAELRRFSASAVERWDWMAVGARLGEPQPLARERYEGLSRVRRLAGPPAEGQSGERCGYESGGAVVWRHVTVAGSAVSNGSSRDLGRS